MINLSKYKYIASMAVFVFLSTITKDSLWAQSVHGSVIEIKTQEPLAFVHIGIRGKGVGTISDEKGQFNLQLNKDFHADTLTFSMIGYENLKVPIDSLLNGNSMIKMKPSPTQLKEAVVKSDKIRETLEFGRTEPTKMTTGASGKDNYGVGQEIGTTIKNDGGKYIIDAISFHHRWNTVDSILYRINIYTLKNGLPDTSILQNELFVMAYKRDKWITKQVGGEVVLFEQDLFVSIELVRRWNNKGDNLLFYSHGVGQRECKNYIRSTSQGTWTTDFAFPLTLYLTVEKLE